MYTLVLMARKLALLEAIHLEVYKTFTAMFHFELFDIFLKLDR